MLFNSLEFLAFLTIVFTVYWLIAKHLLVRNLFLIVAAYVFYGWWDYRFLALIFISSSVDFLVGLGIQKAKSETSRKLIFSVSVATNLAVLGFFKYFNFFADSASTLLSHFGFSVHWTTLQIVLPVGLSFYTFQSLSYIFDIYRKKTEATSNYLNYMAYVSFFPQLVAGPIERSKNLLSQFFETKSFSMELATAGVKQMAWGFFKKMVIADNCAVFVNEIFGRSSFDQTSGLTLLVAAFLFVCQIYCDFSGYSDIAIGTAKLFGFRLSTNFKLPLFSRSIPEFWTRWHMSLSTWFKDYLYIPLGGNRGSKWLHCRNILITFTVSGLWHGASFNYLLWGFLNGLYFLPSIFRKRNKNQEAEILAANTTLPSWREWRGVVLTLLLTTFAFVFFRAHDLGTAISFLTHIVTNLPLGIGDLKRMLIVKIFCCLVLLFGLEFIARKLEHPLLLTPKKKFLRYGTYATFSLFVLSLAVLDKPSFIYFQF